MYYDTNRTTPATAFPFIAPGCSVHFIRSYVSPTSTSAVVWQVVDSDQNEVTSSSLISAPWNSLSILKESSIAGYLFDPFEPYYVGSGFVSISASGALLPWPSPAVLADGIDICNNLSHSRHVSRINVTSLMVGIWFSPCLVKRSTLLQLNDSVLVETSPSNSTCFYIAITVADSSTISVEMSSLICSSRNLVLFQLLLDSDGAVLYSVNGSAPIRCFTSSWPISQTLDVLIVTTSSCDSSCGFVRALTIDSPVNFSRLTSMASSAMIPPVMISGFVTSADLDGEFTFTDTLNSCSVSRLNTASAGIKLVPDRVSDYLPSTVSGQIKFGSPSPQTLDITVRI